MEKEDILNELAAIDVERKHINNRKRMDIPLAILFIPDKSISECLENHYTSLLNHLDKKEKELTEKLKIIK